MSHSVSVRADAAAHRRGLSITETIAAIATAPGPAAIAVVRLSGPQAYAIADRVLPLCRPRPSERSAQTFAYGELVHPHSQERIDGVLALFFRAPRSYTGEDSIEFQGHGGVVNAGRMLDAVCAAGARQAERGEFTRRAVAHGKLDPLRAEAVLNLIEARSVRAAQSAKNRLDGALSRQIETLYADSCGLLAELEPFLDVDEAEWTDAQHFAFQRRLRQTLRRIVRLLRSWYAGHVLFENARVVLSGLPNSGKSTLFNRLLDRDRAIVSTQPGTTRDTVEETVLIDGYPIRLIDTAGLRDSDCEIERQGVSRSHAAMQGADLTLLVVDATQPLTDDLQAMLNRFDPATMLLVCNKSDQPLNPTLHALARMQPVACSALTGKGLEPLKTRLLRRLHLEVEHPPEVAISTAQRDVLRDVLRGVWQTRALLGEHPPELLLAATQLRRPIDRLGALLGRQAGDDLLNALFDRFCVGK